MLRPEHPSGLPFADEPRVHRTPLVHGLTGDARGLGRPVLGSPGHEEVEGDQLLVVQLVEVQVRNVAGRCAALCRTPPPPLLFVKGCLKEFL